MNDSNINLAHSDCLYSQTNWGETIVHNICTGAETAVPWGSIDYMFALVIAIGSFAVIALAISFAAVVTTDIFRD